MKHQILSYAFAYFLVTPFSANLLAGQPEPDCKDVVRKIAELEKPYIDMTTINSAETQRHFREREEQCEQMNTIERTCILKAKSLDEVKRQCRYNSSLIDTFPQAKRAKACGDLQSRIQHIFKSRACDRDQDCIYVDKDIYGPVTNNNYKSGIIQNKKLSELKRSISELTIYDCENKLNLDGDAQPKLYDLQCLKSQCVQKVDVPLKPYLGPKVAVDVKKNGMNYVPRLLKQNAGLAIFQNCFGKNFEPSCTPVTGTLHFSVKQRGSGIGPNRIGGQENCGDYQGFLTCFMDSFSIFGQAEGYDSREDNYTMDVHIATTPGNAQNQGKLTLSCKNLGTISEITKTTGGSAKMFHLEFNDQVSLNVFSNAKVPEQDEKLQSVYNRFQSCRGSNQRINVTNRWLQPSGVGTFNGVYHGWCTNWDMIEFAP